MLLEIRQSKSTLFFHFTHASVEAPSP